MEPQEKQSTSVTPKVTIHCLVYNHEPFLRQCLDGLVMQQTNFPFEAIVHDDVSTDGSAAIIREYAEKYPDIIKPIFETENQYPKHDGSLRRIMNAHTRGKYVAYCEGDDYWTDPLKLQKQVDFLESHPDYSICYHKVATVNAKTNKTTGYVPHWLPDKPATFELADMEDKNIIQTLSVMYRWIFHEERTEDYIDLGIMPGDWILNLAHATKGKTYYMPEVMGAYRIHEGGIWSSCIEDENTFFRRHGCRFFLFFRNARRITSMRFEKPLKAELRKAMRFCLSEWDIELLNQVRELFPEEMAEVTHSLFADDSTKRARFARKYTTALMGSTFLFRTSRLLFNIHRIFSRKIRNI